MALQMKALLSYAATGVITKILLESMLHCRAASASNVRGPVSSVPTCSLGMVEVPGSNPEKAGLGMGSQIIYSLTARHMKKPTLAVNGL